MISRLPPCYLILSPLELELINDCLVYVFYIVLRYLPVIDNLLLGQIVRGIFLLKQGITAVFLIGQDMFYRLCMPCFLPSRSVDSQLHKLLGYCSEGIACKELAID